MLDEEKARLVPKKKINCRGRKKKAGGRTFDRMKNKHKDHPSIDLLLVIIYHRAFPRPCPHGPTDRTVFEPGMVMTCEPGLYVAAEGIGIRLENDILITQGAPEDLVGERLLCPEEIERIMQEK